MPPEQRDRLGIVSLWLFCFVLFLFCCFYFGFYSVCFLAFHSPIASENHEGNRLSILSAGVELGKIPPGVPMLPWFFLLTSSVSLSGLHGTVHCHKIRVRSNGMYPCSRRDEMAKWHNKKEKKTGRGICIHWMAQCHISICSRKILVKVMFIRIHLIRKQWDRMGWCDLPMKIYFKPRKIQSTTLRSLLRKPKQMQNQISPVQHVMFLPIDVTPTPSMTWHIIHYLDIPWERREPPVIENRQFILRVPMLEKSPPPTPAIPHLCPKGSWSSKYPTSTAAAAQFRVDFWSAVWWLLSSSSRPVWLPGCYGPWCRGCGAYMNTHPKMTLHDEGMVGYATSRGRVWVCIRVEDRPQIFPQSRVFRPAGWVWGVND